MIESTEVTHEHKRHPCSRSPEQIALMSMKQRCYNHKHVGYPRYGGRGIVVCERWLGRDGLKHFLEDMGTRPSKKHSLDRYPDNDGPYCKDNCRWASPKEQQRNKRNTRRISGRPQLEVSGELGLSENAIAERLRNGWTEDEALGPRCARRSDDCRIMFHGESRRIIDVAREVGIGLSVLHARVRRWGDVERAVNSPVVHRRRHHARVSV